jgi:hypothetical protein
MFKSGKLELKDKLLERFFNSKEIYAKNPMATFDVALKFIDNKDFDTAEKILEFGQELAKRFNGEFYTPYYLLNKLQIKTHKGEEFNQKELTSLQKIRETSNVFAKYGASILLKDYKDAEENLRKIREKTSIEHMATWPITKLFLPHLQDEELKRKLENK